MTDNEIQVTLPWPPSVNHYWRSCVADGHVKTYVSKQGAQFQQLVRALTCMRWRRPPIDYKCSVLVEAWAPNRREWDVDNRCKALLDSLQKAGVLENDKQVRDLRIVDRGISPPGRIVVSIRRFSGGTHGQEAKQQQRGTQGKEDPGEAVADPAQARWEGYRALVDPGTAHRGDGQG